MDGKEHRDSSTGGVGGGCGVSGYRWEGLETFRYELAGSELSISSNNGLSSCLE